MCRVVRLVCKAQNKTLKAIISLESENSKFGFLKGRKKAINQIALR